MRLMMMNVEGYFDMKILRLEIEGGVDVDEIPDQEICWTQPNLNTPVSFLVRIPDKGLMDSCCEFSLQWYRWERQWKKSGAYCFYVLSNQVFSIPFSEHTKFIAYF
jgi:hypothetical protein